MSVLRFSPLFQRYRRSTPPTVRSRTNPTVGIFRANHYCTNRRFSHSRRHGGLTTHADLEVYATCRLPRFERKDICRKPLIKGKECRFPNRQPLEKSRFGNRHSFRKRDLSKVSFAGLETCGTRVGLFYRCVNGTIFSNTFGGFCVTTIRALNRSNSSLSGNTLAIGTGRTKRG